MALKGLANPAATSEFASRSLSLGIPATGFRLLGKTGLTCAIIGFGTYRIDDEVATHHEALKLALTSGCNLIDTSTNYSDGRSESCIGDVLTVLNADKKVLRESVVLVSKVGYVQGNNLLLAQEREKDQKSFPEMVKYMDGCWHCIHPDFIRDQIERSLQRLNVEQLDIYLLHNPEYYLTDATKQTQGISTEQFRTEYYRRIKSAFECLEQLVKEGKIGQYGISSNTFVSPADDPEFTSLDRVWEIAQSISQGNSQSISMGHHFTVIQLPANLIEVGAMLEKNNGDKTVLELAKELNLGVLVNRPLNAIVDGDLIRLADFETKNSGDPKTFAAHVHELEQKFTKEIAPLIKAVSSETKLDSLFDWGAQIINANLKQLSLERWRQVASQGLHPQVKYLVGQLNQYFANAEPPSWTLWRE